MICTRSSTRHVCELPKPSLNCFYYGLSKTNLQNLKTQKSIFRKFAKFTIHNLLWIYSINAHSGQKQTDNFDEIIQSNA